MLETRVYFASDFSAEYQWTCFWSHFSFFIIDLLSTEGRYVSWTMCLHLHSQSVKMNCYQE